ncbi:MAG: hypothetical protein M2R46_03451 [Verrucomicrobia subdivision 3 bacterium]|nr:hypothetical protein [Limisphaerales bacterium]
MPGPQQLQRAFGDDLSKDKNPIAKMVCRHRPDLMLNAEKSLSSCQLAHDLALEQKSAYMAVRIRLAMRGKQKSLLRGISSRQTKLI